MVVLCADIGTSEQDLVNNTFILYDGCDGKSDSDDENSEDHLHADEREIKPENEIASGEFSSAESRIHVSKFYDLQKGCLLELDFLMKLYCDRIRRFLDCVVNI